MKRPILDIRYKAILGVGILGMALSVTGWSQTLPEAPKPQQRAFYVLTVGTYAAGYLDAHTSLSGQHDFGYHEVNPLLGRHPSNVRMYATVGAANTGCVLWSRHLLRKGSRRWYWPMVGCIAANVGGAANNWRKR